MHRWLKVDQRRMTLGVSKNEEDANVMENLVIDQSISPGPRASFRPSPNAPSDLKTQEKEESRERCLIETFLAVGRDRPSRNLKCQVKFQ